MPKGSEFDKGTDLCKECEFVLISEANEYCCQVGWIKGYDK
jgi:hypothetical protein